ncbi:hypothetical protein [Paenibacillus sp. NFR01]|uniref:hypothetical protein n=1 Tax=Paenibacillus sp. NFR01 TaxID=1566279 RepID=UPI000B84D223|nr:hypothetical protein [Paenibacillus sp. NFR01]
MYVNKRSSSVKPKMVYLSPWLLALIVTLIAGSLAACSNSAGEHAQPTKETPVVTQASGRIYLYGEVHGNAKVMDKEFELWSGYYHKEGMRHLFVELPYYTAEYLNLWMHSDNDDLLNEIYEDWQGTAGYNPYTKAFYKKIKSECPETIFHGTDVGHQYDTTGSRFLSYLEANDRTGSEAYTLTREAIEQGRYYYSKDDDVYRENKMAENFIREFEKLGSANIMGIYGSAHTGLDEMDYDTHTVPCMANQLKKHYGGHMDSEDLSLVAKENEPIRTDHITLLGKEYTASYFGKEEMTGFKNYAYREFWRLEDAYEDVKDLPLVENYLPYNNYPMLIGTGQVFVIRYTKTDGSVDQEYYLSNGHVWNGGMYATQQFQAD